MEDRLEYIIGEVRTESISVEAATAEVMALFTQSEHMEDKKQLLIILQCEECGRSFHQREYAYVYKKKWICAFCRRKKPDKSNERNI